MTKTIVVLDDHQIFALGLDMMLGTLPDPVHCLPRADAPRAVSEVEAGTLTADLFVVDFYIPGSHAPDLVRRLRVARPGTPVLMVSASHNPADRAGAMAAGALGFVNKSADPAEILNAISAALSGQMPDTVAPDPLATLGLTPRQTDIVLLVSKGLSNKEIGQMLGVSPETVKTHLKHIFRRLGVNGRVEALDQLRGLGLA